jgi:hypothetical protein
MLDFLSVGVSVSALLALALIAFVAALARGFPASAALLFSCHWRVPWSARAWRRRYS